jgi:fatty acid desaturase
MLSLFVLAAFCTMVGMAAPPMLLVAAFLWFIFFRRARRNIRIARDAQSAKVLRAQERRYEKALRFFA